MVRCSVLNCKSDTKTKGLSFYSFPAQPDLLSLWIAATGRENWVPKKSSKMCCKHFKSSFLRRKGNRRYLRMNAVPIKEETEETLESINIHECKTEIVEHAFEEENLPVLEQSEEILSMDIYKCKTEASEHTSEEENLPLLVKVETLASTSPIPMEMQHSETATLKHASIGDQHYSQVSDCSHPQIWKDERMMKIEISPAQPLNRLRTLFNLKLEY